VPEIPLYKDVKYSGHAEIKITTIDGETREFVGDSAPAVGQANYDAFTILVVINFTRTDFEMRQSDLGEG
jgi:hypothetical protein